MTPSDPLAGITGWSRDHFLALADGMLAAAQRVGSPAHAGVRFLGHPGGFGPRVDALEGFARTFMLAGFRIAGSSTDMSPLAEWYAAGLDAGTRRSSPERWPRPDEIDQAKVEAAALAIGLHFSWDAIWRHLPDRVQGQIVDYLSTALGGRYPRNNWAWFRIVVSQFLANVGADHSRSDMEEDLALLASFFRPGGWISDGESRAYDHYVGWALHFYPVIWEAMLPPGDPLRAHLPRYAAAREHYLRDAVSLVGADGSPLIQGRSLTYRFAAAAPFWAGAMSGSDSVELGVLRRAAAGVVSHFARNGAPTVCGELPLGWHSAWRQIAQSYSGPGSPYWASKGLLGVALPEPHPVWHTAELPLPVEQSDFVRVLVAPGWLAVGTRSDGIVRVYNHGTDHGHPDIPMEDAPLYAKFAYSTATAPLLATAASRSDPDQSVSIVSEAIPGNRTGFRCHGVTLLECSDGSFAGFARSSARSHWITDPPDHPDHGTPWPGGTVRYGPSVAVSCIARGAWEVRFIRVLDDVGAGDVLRVSGWALSGATVTVARSDEGSSVLTEDRVARLLNLGGFDQVGASRIEAATFLGSQSAECWAEVSDPRKDIDYVVALQLRGAKSGDRLPWIEGGPFPRRRIYWGDGAHVELDPWSWPGSG